MHDLTLSAPVEVLGPDTGPGSPPGTSLVQVAAAAHPFRAARDVVALPAGLSLTEMLEAVQADPMLRRHAHIAIDGTPVPRENWHRVRPKPGAHVTIRVVPQGGDNKSLGTVLSIVVLVAAAVVSQNPAVIAALGSTGAAVAGVTVSVVGTLIITQLVPPPSQNLDGLSGGRRDSPNLFLSGTRNEARPYGVVPVVLGRHRIFPPLAAPPFTEVQGNRQYLRAVFCIGLGDYKLTQFKIGDTPLDRFDGTRLKLHQADPAAAPTLKFFPSVVKEEPLNIKLRKKDGWRLRRTEPEVTQFSADITFPGGLIKIQEDGDRKKRTVAVEMEYREVGTSDWSIGAAGKAFGAQQSPAMAAPPSVTRRLAEGDILVIGQHQIWRLVMDPQSGDLELTAGAAVEAFHISGAPFLTLDLEEAEPPPWPEFKIRIAEVLRVTGEATIGASRITDVRDTKRAFPEGASFAGGSDFAAGPTGPASDKIELAAGTVIFAAFTTTAKRTSALRRSILVDPPQSDPPVPTQYEVRLKRTTADASGGGGDVIVDEVFWTALRSFDTTTPAVARKNVTLAELRIKATGQLNGVIDTFNCVAHSILPDWDGTDWSNVRSTRNPAALLRAVLDGAGNARPLAESRLDLTSLQDFHEWCVSERWTFDMVRDFPATVFETLGDLAAAGRAAPAVLDGKWGVVIDRPQSAVIQHFTPRNSFGFQGAKAFAELPEGFRVRYVDKARRWRQKEHLVFRPGFDQATATKFEGLDLPGVTSKALVERHAIYHLAVAELRPETWSFSTDVEALVCTRGDLVKITHDVILAGLASGRIKAVTTDGGGDVTALELDEVVAMELGKSYAIAIRTLGDANVLGTVTTDPGEQTTIALSPAIPAAQAPAVGDLFGFGESGLETLDAVVKSIEPGPDLTYRVTCVPAAAGVHTADKDFIAAFDPGISEPVGLARPAVEAIRSDESVLLRDSDGSFRSRILVTLFRPAGLPTTVSGIEAQIRPLPEDGGDDEQEAWDSRLLPRDAGEVSFTEVIDGEDYALRFRYLLQDGDFGDFTAVFEHRAVGQSAPPPDVPNLFFENGRLLWDYPNAPQDLAGFEVKTHAGDNRAYASALDAHPAGLVAAPPFDISSFAGGTRSFLVKAVDTSGNRSVNAAVLVLGLGDVLTDNVVLSTDYHPAFPGTIVNGAVNAGVLEAAATGDHWLADDANVLWRGEDSNPVWDTQFLAMVYEAGYTPPGPARLSLGIAIDSLDGWSLEVAEALVAPRWEGVDANPVWSGVDANAWWAATPGAFFAWPGALDLLRREYRLRLTTFQGTRLARLSALTAVLDVPDVLESLNDVAISAGGTRLPITKAFTVITGVRLTQQDDGGDAVRLVLKDRDAALGPLVQGEDAASAGAAATVDAQVQGYTFETM